MHFEKKNKEEGGGTIPPVELKRKEEKVSDIELGSKAKCVITGFEGVVTSRHEYISGAVKYTLTPEVCSSGNLKDEQTFHYERLKVLRAGFQVCGKDSKLGFYKKPSLLVCDRVLD